MFTIRCIFQKNAMFGMVIICFLPFHLFESRASIGGCFVTEGNALVCSSEIPLGRCRCCRLTGSSSTQGKGSLFVIYVNKPLSALRQHHGVIARSLASSFFCFICNLNYYIEGFVSPVDAQ